MHLNSSVVFVSWILLLVGLCPTLTAEPVAGMRMVHAVGRGTGPLQVEINGRPWSREPFAPGGVSSLRRVQAGRHHLRIARQGLEPLSLGVTLRAGESLSLVCHAHQTAESSPWSIAVHPLRDLPASQARSLRILHLGQTPSRRMEIRQAGKAWSSIFLVRREPQQLEILQPRGYLPMRVGEGLLSALPVGHGGGHVVILYDGPKGEPRSLSYRERPLIQDPSP